VKWLVLASVDYRLWCSQRSALRSKLDLGSSLDFSSYLEETNSLFSFLSSPQIIEEDSCFA